MMMNSRLSPISIRNSLNHVTQYAFNTDFGEVEKALDPNGYLRCWAYDDFGRLQARKDNDSTATIDDSCTRALANFDYSENNSEIGDPENQRILATEHSGGRSGQHSKPPVSRWPGSRLPRRIGADGGHVCHHGARLGPAGRTHL